MDSWSDKFQFYRIFPFCNYECNSAVVVVQRVASLLLQLLDADMVGTYESQWGFGSKMHMFEMDEKSRRFMIGFACMFE